MEKFTKVKKAQETQIQKNKDSIAYDGYIKVIKTKDNYEFTTDADCVVCLIYIKDEGYILMRSEVIPPWTYKYKNNINKLSDYFLTLVSGTIEDGETPQKCLRRELYEEAGLVLNEFKELNIEGPFFQSKGTTSQFYTCLLELEYNDYKLVAAPGDGSNLEKISKTIKINIANLDKIKINDMISSYLLEKMKNKYNLS
jgi:8-oxo-dGTP pyrophosphatase MutT (NUDIX family)